MKITWDEKKNRANIRKHGLDFTDAAQVFEGPMLTRFDPREDYGEDRWIGIGMTRGRVVVLVYTESDDGQTNRIISMRKALSHEERRYEETF